MKLPEVLDNLYGMIPDSYKGLLLGDLCFATSQVHFPESHKALLKVCEFRMLTIEDRVKKLPGKNLKLKELEKEIEKSRKISENFFAQILIDKYLDLTLEETYQDFRNIFNAIEPLVGSETDFFDQIYLFHDKVKTFQLKNEISSHEVNQLFHELEDVFEKEIPKKQLPPFLFLKKIEEGDIKALLEKIVTMFCFFQLEKATSNILMEIYREVDSNNFISVEQPVEPNQKLNEVLFETPPISYEKIKSRLSEQEIKNFFSFLYLEKDKTGKPFLEKSEVIQLVKYGLSFPTEPTGKYFKLHFGEREITIGMLCHLFFKLGRSACNNASYSKEKTKVATFLKYNFENFKDMEIDEIKNKMRSYAPKGTFDVKRYIEDFV